MQNKKSNSKEFLYAAEIVKKLNTTPSEEDQLKLYGLYKQAIFGNNNQDKPFFLDIKGTKKWDSWYKNKNKSKYNCEIEYIKTVNLLIKKHGINKF